MLPKCTAEHVTKMKVCQVQFNKELAEAQEEADREERQHAEEVAAKKKKAAEVKAAQERHEREEAKAWVARCEAHMKMLVPVGEPIMALGSDSDIEPGVRLLGVTNLVSKIFFLLVFM